MPQAALLPDSVYLLHRLLYEAKHAPLVNLGNFHIFGNVRCAGNQLIIGPLPKKEKTIRKNLGNVGTA
jgi:hypothetical protein